MPHARFQFPDQGPNLCPLQWKHRALNTALPGKPLLLALAQLLPPPQKGLTHRTSKLLIKHKLQPSHVGEHGTFLPGELLGRIKVLEYTTGLDKQVCSVKMASIASQKETTYSRSSQPRTAHEALCPLVRIAHSPFQELACSQVLYHTLFRRWRFWI